MFHNLDALDELGRILSWWRIREADEAKIFGVFLAISHDRGVLDFSELLEELWEVLLSETLVLGEAFHAHIVEWVLGDGHVSFLSLVLKDSQDTLGSVAIWWKIVLVHLNYKKWALSKSIYLPPEWPSSLPRSCQTGRIHSQEARGQRLLRLCSSIFFRKSKIWSIDRTGSISLWLSGWPDSVPNSPMRLI